MGNALKIVTEADFRPGYRRITSKDLNDRLLESTPAIDAAVSGAGSEIDTVATESPWQSAAIFKHLSKAECQEIVSSGARRQYAGRQLIVHEGDEGRAVLMVMWGRVKVSQVSHTGDEVILRVQGSGEVIGGLGMLPGESPFIHNSGAGSVPGAELEGGRFSLAMRALSGTATECAADHE